MKMILKYLEELKKECVLAPLFKMLEALFELFVPLVVASIIDRGIGQQDTAYIVKMCLMLLGLAIIGLVCSITAQYFAAKAAAGAAGPGRHPGRPAGDRVQPERCAVPDRELAEPAGLVQQSGLLLHRLYHPERGGDPDPHQHQLRCKAAGRPAQWLDRLRVRCTGRGGVPCGRMARHPHWRGLRRDLLPCPPSQKEKVKNFFKTLDIHPPLWYYT